jgi:archaetidylinositol phosphate synthase
MGIAHATPGQDFHEAQRVLRGFTAATEKRLLRWLAAHTPAGITPDHLTFLGLLSMAACGVLYAASAWAPALLLAVNAGLAANWLGDSLDGTLARHRHSERPRFGFYVDHLVDAFGALFVLLGLGLSGWMSPLVAATLLVAYFLLAIETYLATYAIGAFKISWGPFGGTELRILLAALNVIVMTTPRIRVAGHDWLVFDVIGLAATLALLVVATAAGIRGTRALARLEGWAKPAPRG